MKKLAMICFMGMTLVFGACAHKHGGCKDGSCKIEKSEKKDCDCGEHKSAEPAKTDEKKQ